MDAALHEARTAIIAGDRARRRTGAAGIAVATAAARRRARHSKKHCRDQIEIDQDELAHRRLGVGCHLNFRRTMLSAPRESRWMPTPSVPRTVYASSRMLVAQRIVAIQWPA